MIGIHNRIVALVLALVVVSGAAVAQRNAPKCTSDDPCSVTTGPSAWTTSGAVTLAYPSQPIAIVSHDGEVTINWEQAEKTVAAPDSVDAMTLAIARLMVAIRDGTWKAGEAK